MHMSARDTESERASMRLFECRECGRIANEDEISYHHYASDYCMGVPVLKGREMCPDCGSTDLTVLGECEICGEPTEDARHRLCPRCGQIAKDIAEYAKVRYDLGNYELVNLLDAYEDENR